MLETSRKTYMRQGESEQNKDKTAAKERHQRYVPRWCLLPDHKQRQTFSAELQTPSMQENYLNHFPLGLPFLTGASAA